MKNRSPLYALTMTMAAVVAVATFAAGATLPVPLAPPPAPVAATLDAVGQAPAASDVAPALAPALARALDAPAPSARAFALDACPPGRLVCVVEASGAPGPRATTVPVYVSAPCSRVPGLCESAGPAMRAAVVPSDSTDDLASSVDVRVTWEGLAAGPMVRGARAVAPLTLTAHLPEIGPVTVVLCDALSPCLVPWGATASVTVTVSVGDATASATAPLRSEI